LDLFKEVDIPKSHENSNGTEHIVVEEEIPMEIIEEK
jgi:hypothetical protein